MAPYKPADEIVPHPDEDIRVWMTEHGPALRRYFLKKVGPNEADDLVQEVFLSLQVRGSEGRIENVQGYLFRMAATALIRRRERRKWDWPNHEILDETLEIFLHRFEEMTYVAIAARMKTTVKAVDHLIQRALKRILEARDQAQ